jgi:hypothetical protein
MASRPKRSPHDLPHVLEDAREMDILESFQGAVIIGPPRVEGRPDVPFVESEQALISGRVRADIPGFFA